MIIEYEINNEGVLDKYCVQSKACLMSMALESMTFHIVTQIHKRIITLHHLKDIALYMFLEEYRFTCMCCFEKY